METAEQIADALTKWTVEHSGYEPRRNYIGLSRCSLPVDEIVRLYRDEVQVDELSHLRCYKGYQIETDLLRRLKLVFGDRIQLGGEISAFAGFVKGHPDFFFDGFPGDCKTVPLDEHLQEPGRLSRRIFFQLQGYMAFSGKERALVVHESRENGLIRALWLFKNMLVQYQIHTTLSQAVAIIRAGQ